ncbi:MAG: hypothetical protein ABIP30_02375 [Ferruginibacter sp.]
MKNIIFLSILILTFLCNAEVLAQTTFEAPPVTTVISKEDSTKLEASIVNAVNWIETTDLDKQHDKRKDVNGFILKWYIDVFTLNISLVEKLSSINEGNSDLLLIYFGGFAKYYIENKTTYTKLAATKAGLISVMTVYKKGIGITKSKELEKLIKLTGENKLDDYVKENFD